MRLKTFTSDELHKALGMVKRELGDEAVIVSTKRDSDGMVHVMAAVDDEKVYSQGEFLTKVLTSNENINKEKLFANDNPQPQSYADNIIKERLTKDPFTILDDLSHMLTYHRVPNEIIEKLISHATELRPGIDHVDIICDLFKFAPIEFSKKTPKAGHNDTGDQGIVNGGSNQNTEPTKETKTVLLVGPPGAGKSLASAKLAFNAMSVGRKVHIITCDNLKAGAIHQSFSYTKAMNMTLSVAKSARDLELIINNRKQKYDVLIIDTPGINPFSNHDIKELAKYVIAAQTLPTLVFPANTDVYECMDTIDRFKVIGARQCIVTRLDTCRRLGSIIVAGFEKKLALSFFGNGPTLADILIPANSKTMHSLLEKHNIESYKNIPTEHVGGRR